MSRLGLGNHQVSRFQGKQEGRMDRLGESRFLSGRHIDWWRTRAYAQGNFGQIFLNVKGRQPHGCVAPEGVRALLDEVKAGLMTIPHPETGEPLVEHIYERDELYHGPHAGLSPDLTVVLTDWRYRTIGLHDFTTNKVITPAFGPTGDHRLEGILIATGPGFQVGAEPRDAALLDIAPTVLHLLGVPVPDDMDGRVLTELLEPMASRSAHVLAMEPAFAEARWPMGGLGPAGRFRPTPTTTMPRSSGGWPDLGYLLITRRSATGRYAPPDRRTSGQFWTILP